MDKFKKRLTPILLLTLLLAACAGNGANESGATMMDTEATMVESDRAGTTATDGGGGDDSVAEGEAVSFNTPSTRKVIHRASIAIEAEDTRAVMNAVEELVARTGGFVESASVSDPASGEDQPQIRLVLRVPASDLPTTLDTIGALGTRVVSETQEGKDVTEEYVDVEARIDNLSALETELRALLTAVRDQPDAEPAELLQVFNEISRVRGEIEQLEGRRQVLDDLTALATLEVSVAPTPEVAPVVADGWAPTGVFRDSVRSLVSVFQGLADLVIRVVVLGVPLLLIVGLPGLVGWRLWRRYAIARPATTPAQTEAG